MIRRHSRKPETPWATLGAAR